MKKRIPFTAIEHLAIGKKLREIEDEINEIGYIIQTAYPLAISSKAFKAAKVIRSLCSDLDSEICRENPLPAQDVHGVPIVKVYYGWKNGPNRKRDDRSDATRRGHLAEKAARLFDDGNPWDV